MLALAFILALATPSAHAGKKARTTARQQEVEAEPPPEVAQPREDPETRAQVLTDRVMMMIAANVKAPDPASTNQARALLDEAMSLVDQPDWAMLNASGILHIFARQPEPALTHGLAAIERYAAAPPKRSDVRILGGTGMIALNLLLEHRQPQACLDLATRALALDFSAAAPPPVEERAMLHTAQALAIRILDTPSAAHLATLQAAAAESPEEAQVLQALAIQLIHFEPEAVEAMARRALEAGADPFDLHGSLTRVWLSEAQELANRSQALPDGPEAEALFLESAAMMAASRPGLERLQALEPDQPKWVRFLIQACQAGGDYEATQRWQAHLATLEAGGG